MNPFRLSTTPSRPHALLTLLLTVSIGWSAACAHTRDLTSVSAADAEASVRRWFDEWTAATDAGDQERAHSLLADDVLFLVPGFGRMDPKVFVEGASGSPQKLETYEFTGGVEIEEVRVEGPLAYLLCKADFSITVKATGDQTRYYGYSLSVLERGPDGAWKLIRDANTVLPI